MFFFSDAKKIPLDKVTKHFCSCPNIFFLLATRIFFLLLEKRSWGKKKTALSLYQEVFSWSQKKCL